MPKASNTLPQPDTFQPISATALHVLARLATKKAVVEQLRNEGRRVTLIPPAEINPKVREYLQAHPELYEQAVATAWEIAARDHRGQLRKWLFGDQRSRKWSRQSVVCDRSV